MTNEEYKIISEAIEKCKENIELSFSNFAQGIELLKKYPDAFISEQEQQTNENN